MMPPNGLASNVSEYEAKTNNNLAIRFVGGKKYSPSTEAMNNTSVRSKTSTIQPNMPPNMALTFKPPASPSTLPIIDEGNRFSISIT